MMLLILLLLPLLLLYFYLKNKLNYWKKRNIPHEEPNLLFGNLAALAFRSEGPSEYFEKLYTKFSGPYFGFYAFAKPWLIVKDPDLIKRILIKDNHIFPDRFIITDESIDPILSNALLGIKAPKWKLLRTKLSPVFTSGKIKAMLHLMVECSDNLIEFINFHTESSVEVKEMAAKYTTDVITSCAFGIEANSFVSENSEFRVAGRRLFQSSFSRAIAGLCYFFAPALVKVFRFKFIDGEAAAFLRKAFNETIKLREESKIKRNDLIDILIELKNSETKDDEFKFYGDRLVAQAVIFFGAGQETTSSAIAFTLHELCINTNIQTRLRNEIEATISKHGGLTYEAVQDMKYLNMVLCETLRKYPLTPFLNRHCEEDYKIPETGLTIEKGTPILISQRGLHWDKKYFPSPEVYNPERFSAKEKDKIPNYVYLPFGDGPRSCIGERFAQQSSKLGIIQVVRNFEIVRSSDTRDPLVFSRSGLLQAIPGVFVTFRKLPKNKNP